jgi:uncharacterized membrane protein YhhN
MTEILILAAAVPLMTGLLLFEKRESARGLLLTKPFLSLLFIAAALTGPGSDPAYFGLILAGLICCLAGDVCLIFFFSRPLFLAGLASFLAGHVLYAVAFFLKAPPGAATWIIGACFVVVGGVVFAWLRPHLGKMFLPVVAYMVIITAMAVGAASLLKDENAGAPGRYLAFAGAILFYVSDIFVARHRFVAKAYINRLLGLPLYYAAQFLIAFSIRLL